MSRLWLKTVVLTLLAGSLAANVLAVFGMKDAYAREWRVRRHPVGLGPWPTSGPADGLPVLLLGDSRMKLWPTLDLPGRKIVNAGVGGETTAQILLRLDAVLTETRPAVVVIEAGINDLRTVPLFPDEADEIEGVCRENLLRIAERCRAAGARVVLMPIWRTGSVDLAHRPLWNARARLALERINRSLASFSAGSGLGWLDANAMLTAGDFRDPWHLRRPSYARLTAPLQEAVEAALARP